MQNMNFWRNICFVIIFTDSTVQVIGQKIISEPLTPDDFKAGDKLDSLERNHIARAITEFTKQTCVQIIPWEKSQKYYLIIKPEDDVNSCHTNGVGFHDPPQTLELGKKCFERRANGFSSDEGHVGSIMHEFMHAIGFIHEQSRDDRDTFVKIITDNIKPGKASQFTKRVGSNANKVGPYEYGSLMHYTLTSFGIIDNKTMKAKPTIEPLMPTMANFGQRLGLTQKDILKINKWHGCKTISGRTEINLTGNPEIVTTGTMCRDLNKKCAKWAKDNYCSDERVSSYMQSYCQKSCQFCVKT